MKAVLICQREEVKEMVQKHLEPLGMSVIHYRNPIKAMDNLDEIDPEIVMCSAMDFPRHWKPLLLFLRNHKSKDQTIFLLLTRATMPEEEVNKSTHLGATAILNENLDDPREIARLKLIISRYKFVSNDRGNQRYLLTPYDKIDFILSHPVTGEISGGKIIDISTQGMRFAPYDSHFFNNVPANTILYHSTFRVDDTLFNVQNIVVSSPSEPFIRLSYLKMDESMKALLKNYLSGQASREIQFLSAANA